MGSRATPAIRTGPLEALVAAATALIFAVAPAANAQAQEAPRWSILATSNPTTFVPAATPEPQIVLTATNVGGAASDGSTVTVADTLPAGVTASAVTGYSAYQAGSATNGEGGGASAMSCTAPPALACTYSGPVDPGDALIVTIRLDPIETTFAGLDDSATVAGGGAGAAATHTSLTSASTPTPFGFAPGSLLAATSTGQAGAHPNVTTAFTLDTGATNELAAYPKDLHFDLPPGLVGSTVGMPTCPISHVIEQLRNPNGCPADTMVGIATAKLSEGFARGFNDTIVAPIYNIAPAAGEPAAFAFNAFFFPVRLDTSVIAGGAYNVRVGAAAIPEAAQSLSVQTTFWGVPADHSGPGRDVSIYDLLAGGGSFGGPNPTQTRVPLLTAPQQCSHELTVSASADSWTHPGAFVASETASMGTPTGCEDLLLEPSFTMLPDTSAPDAPAGYTLDLRVPQNASPDGLATPELQSVRLALPEGTTLNPSVAGGLSACSNAQFGLGQQGPAVCPPQSQIGTVEVRTPTLPLPLTGELFVGEPECNPCTPVDAQGGRLIRLFLQVAGEGEQSVIVKLTGTGQIDQQTGQLTTSFEDEPQLPFSQLTVKLDGGARAPLVNPPRCGTFTTSSDVVPWSAPFTPDASPFSSFEVTGCPNPVPFAPTFTAGTSAADAGASSPFTLQITRADGEQDLSAIATSLPPGLVGMLSRVPLCGEPQASEGTCPPAAQVGTATVAAGAGQPLWLTGPVYLTGPYNGAPFGLSVLVPAQAGPFNLGNVVVRAAITIDPNTSAVTVTTAPLPQSKDGVPVRLRDVQVSIDRPGFMVDPTNCERQRISGAIAGAQGAVEPVATPFAVTGCRDLLFKPVLSVSTDAKTSRLDGASLDVKVAYPSGAQANIRAVKVTLPAQLPTRLTTLQKACPAEIFSSDPAACPPQAVVGVARAQTPVLPVTLAGPAYLVSHGGAAFPDLVLVLQGDGVRVDLTGATDIKKGITTSTFASVPDVPVSSFELYLPQGPDSLLAGYGSLCRHKLAMPTTLTGQNGALINQATKITVRGCPKAKKKKKKKKKTVKGRRRARAARHDYATVQRKGSRT